MDRLRVPLCLALGQYEKLSDKEFDEHFADIQAEATRRNAERTA